ncbi:hypothetical protein HDU67_004279 [Dinochytrium kinnereticum]|nr:hypothetical protein HDU67_004279 [Dinochytrium kinnereticum]
MLLLLAAIASTLTATASASDPACSPYASPPQSLLGYEYAGCFEDSISDRAMEWEWKGFGEMNVTMCLGHCRRFGYPAAGLQWCGDRLNYEKRVSDRHCNFQCDGNPNQCCGGSNRISSENADFAPVFHRPKNKGRFEYIFTAPIVPLVSALTKTNKVVLLEKFSYIIAGGRPNSTHAYEYDYSITDRSKAFREMHVETDVFCSAVHIMPDQWGRLLSVSGMRGVALKGIRVYRPTGTSGVNGTTDWEENHRVLKLQKPRWYPTMQLLRNGSFAIFGGSENADMTGQTPSVEIVPPNGHPSAIVDLLKETDRYNLYPFTYMLPTGNLLLIADTRAVILNSQTFTAIRELPRIPGNPSGHATLDPLGAGGRTYPRSGTSVMLPILPPYTDPVEVLICGGGEAVRKRAIALPDLTFLFINGASVGVSGFATADDPVGTAWIYDPFKPSNQRFEILNWTDIPRMYHSEATLVHDGRVLVSGSDPVDLRYPDEYRLEFFYPPYLTSGIARPTFKVLSGGPGLEFQYGDTIRVSVTLPSGDASKIRASIVSPGANTHGNHMGQRSFGVTVTPTSESTEFILGPLPVSDAVMPPGNYLVFVLDGPTPSVGTWIRVGPLFRELDAWPVGEGFSGMPEWTPQ